MHRSARSAIKKKKSTAYNFIRRLFIQKRGRKYFRTSFLKSADVRGIRTQSRSSNARSQRFDRRSAAAKFFVRSVEASIPPSQPFFFKKQLGTDYSVFISTTV